MILNPLDFETAHARRLDRPLPQQKLVEGEIVPGTGFLHREQPDLHGGQNFCLSSSNPALGRSWRKIVRREDFPIKPERQSDRWKGLLRGHKVGYFGCNPHGCIVALTTS
jgi:hypothetical protein